jgi:hypothetical protein
MTEVVPEAYELVEHGLLTDDDFRDFMFTNAVRFWGEVNPEFFKGTVIEKQAARSSPGPADGRHLPTGRACCRGGDRAGANAWMEAAGRRYAEVLDVRLGESTVRCISRKAPT